MRNMRIIKSDTGNDYAVVSADSKEAARRQAHALGVNLYLEQSRLHLVIDIDPGLVHIIRDDPWEQELRALTAPEKEKT